MTIDTTGALPVKFELLNNIISFGSEGYNLSKIPIRATLWDDLSGVDGAEIVYYSPSKDKSVAIHFYSSSLISGTSTYGVYAPSWGSELNQFAENGRYTVQYVNTWDKAGNRKYLYDSDLRQLGIDPSSMSFSVANSGLTDTTAALPVKFEFSSNTISVGSNGFNLAKLPVQATLSDDLSGVAGAEIVYYSPSKNKSVSVQFYSSSLLSGTATYGSYSPSWGSELNQFSETGQYIVQYLNTWDKAGNRKYFYENDLRSLGIDPNSLSFIVKNGGSSDTTPALPVRFELSDNIVRLGSSGFDLSKLPIRGSFQDDLSGFEVASINYYSPSKNKTVVIDFYSTSLVSGSSLSGVYSPSWGTVLNEFSETGQYSLQYLTTKDKAGNIKYFYESDLRQLGIDPASIGFTVASGVAPLLDGAIVPLTGDIAIDAMTNGYKWQLPANRTVNWSLSDGWSGEYWRYPVETALKIDLALATFSEYADIKFNPVGFFTSPDRAKNAGADINFSIDGANRFFGSNSEWAVGFFPKPGDPNRGDVYLNSRSQANFLESYEPGSAGFFLAIHEIGHTLGLKHPHDTGGTGRPTFSSLGLAAFNVDYITIMSYNDDYNWNLRSWDPATPMVADVLALQYLYGKNTKTNAGDSSYSLVNSNMYMSIWDAAGSDKVNQASANEAWYIVLPSAKLSEKVDTLAGIALPRAQVTHKAPETLYWLLGDIENAEGSIFDDEIYGNSLSNRLAGNLGNDILSGGNGNDTINGGDGKDVALYSGRKQEFSISYTSNKNYFCSAKNGDVDLLIDIERVRFDDQVVALDIDGVSGQAYRLYKAALDRLPDERGLAGWIKYMDEQGTLKAMSQLFIESQEFSANYGALDNRAFINQLYLNVLDRSGEAAGISAWLDGLANGWTRAQVLAAFSESSENKENVIGLIKNGIAYTEWWS